MLFGNGQDPGLYGRINSIPVLILRREQACGTGR